MKDPKLKSVNDLTQSLVSYLAELSEKLPLFPGEFRDLCSVISHECDQIVSSGKIPSGESTMDKMLQIHLKRLRVQSPTRWSRGSGVRCDNVRSFTRYLYRASEIIRELERSANDASADVLLCFYSTVLDFSKNMGESNPAPFHDAYEIRRLKSSAGMSSTSSTPSPFASDSSSSSSSSSGYSTPSPFAQQSSSAPTSFSPGSNGSDDILSQLERALDAAEQSSSRASGEGQVFARDISEEHTIIGVESELVSNDMPLPQIPEHEIHAMIGRGGMGTVYQGLQPFLDRPVAIKVLYLPDQGRRQDIMDRFRREAKILAGLNHPNIVGCYQAGITANNELYIVMELINGPTLDEYIAENGPMDQVPAIELIHQASQALRYAHERDIIHRDVKAQNILLQRNEHTHTEGRFDYIPKLVDLGLARFQEPAPEDMQLTIQGELLGTPSIMAPEQFDNPESIDHRTDIYSLGCVLFFMLTGRTPFSQKTVTEVIRAKLVDAVPNPREYQRYLSEPVCELTRSMLAKRPSERPQCYKEVIMRCDEVLRVLDRDKRPGNTTRGGRLSKIVQRIKNRPDTKK